MITSRAELIDMLKNTLAVEKLARDRYAEEGIEFEDEKISSTVLKIKKDEDRHIEMLEELIEFLER